LFAGAEAAEASVAEEEGEEVSEAATMTTMRDLEVATGLVAEDSAHHHHVEAVVDLEGALLVLPLDG